MKKFLSAILATALSALFVAGTASPAAAADSISLYFSAPFVQGSHLSGAGVSTETFGGMPAGTCASSSVVGTITGTCTVSLSGDASINAAIPNAVPKIGTDVNFSNHVNNSNGTIYTFTNPVKYVGLWWFSGNDGNTFQFYDSSNNLIATLNSATIISFLGNGGYGAMTNSDTGTLTRADGQTVPRRHYYRYPGNYTGTVDNPQVDYNTNTGGNEPWAYLNLFVAGSKSVKKMVTTGGGFEIDNLTVSMEESGPTGSMVLVQNVLGTSPAAQVIAWTPTNTTVSGTSATHTPSQAATVTTPSTGGGAISYSVESAGNSGCTVNSSTGVITRTAAGNCTVRATAAAATVSGQSYYSASKDVTFAFSQAPPQISSPTITSVSPNTGLTTGGTAITITGTGFAAGATVSVGGNACTSVVVVSTTSITCSTPAGTAGAKNVIVTNTDGGTVTSAGAFTYTAPVVNNPSSDSGPTYRSVTFDSNGGTGNTPAVSNYTTSALPAHSLLKPGFVFTSWNTKADGTGIAYADKATYTFTSDVTLYAQWVPVKAAAKIKQYISTFAGDKATLTPKMKTTIAGWVKRLPKDSVITCQGSTSGKKITAFDKRLASNRAKNVCKEAVKKRTDLTYSIKLNPSSATKVSARHVWMIQN